MADERCTLKLPPDVHKELKVAAALRSESMLVIALRAIKRELARIRK